MITCIIFLCICGGMGCLVYKGFLKAYDALLYGGTFLAVAIAIVCSHAYNYQPEQWMDKELCHMAAKQAAKWLHDNFSWLTVSVWMTVMPLYCTCATIYISGVPMADGEYDQIHILIYSILSLVISLGIYVIRPANRAVGFRQAYQLASEAMVKYQLVKDNTILANAIAEGEKIIARQDTLDPK